MNQFLPHGVPCCINAPVVHGVAESWSQSKAQQIQPCGFVRRGLASSFFQVDQNLPHFTQQRRRPVGSAHPKFAADSASKAPWLFSCVIRKHGIQDGLDFFQCRNIDNALRFRSAFVRRAVGLHGGTNIKL